MIKQEVQKLLTEVGLKKGIKQEINIEHPANEEHGDFASNCALQRAKIEKKNPQVLAQEIVQTLPENTIIEKAEVVAPGFINLYLSPEILIKEMMKIMETKEEYGGGQEGKGKTVVIDYSSPNISKPMGVGHLRSTVIGQSLYNIFKFIGYECVGDNHLGDWGTQFGKLIYAYKQWGNKEAVKKNPIPELLKLYVRFTQESEKDESLNEYARKEFKKLEDKDPENTKLWKQFRAWSMEDFSRVYEMLGVKFDHILGESFYEPYLKDVIELLQKEKIAQKDKDGSLVVDLTKYKLGKCLIQKSDGATLYHTRDLATFLYRIKTFKASKILYVVGSEQKLYFKQLFKIIELLGYKTDLVHIDFGLMLLDGKRMATRQGRTVILEEILKEAIVKAHKVIEEKSKNLSEKDKESVARQVGIGAIKYNDLSQNRLTTINFNWQKMLATDGNSAPYLQYTYARAQSILAKVKKEKRQPIIPKKLMREELLLLRYLYRFPEVVREAAENYTPNLIANYLFELTSRFNSFYNNLTVLNAEKDQLQLRLAITESSAQVIKNGLKLLDIEAPERM